MKKFIIGLFFVIFSFTGYSQQEKSNKIIPYNQIEEPPFHKDCEALGDFACSLEKVSQHLNKGFNPSLFGSEKPLLNFTMKFIIDENGKAVWIKPLIESDPIKNEIIRLMKEMPAFEPGRENGKPVSVVYLMPITLRYKYHFPDSYSMNEVDTPPVFDSCKNEEEIKTCFTKELSMIINKKLSNMRMLPEGISSGSIIMLIDEEGNITDYQVRSTSDKFKMGLEKLRKKLPEFESGATLNGEKVKVTINLPVTAQMTSFR